MIRTTKKLGNSVQILEVPVVSTDLQSVLEKITDICHFGLKSSTGGPYFITTVGPEFVMMAQKDKEFARIIAAADLPLAEGVGLRLAKLNLKLVPGRKLVAELILKNYRIFYLGGRDGVARKMAEKYGGMADAGHQDIRSQMRDTRENNRIIEKINNYTPDILLVAYGAPWQEKWLDANRHKLGAKVMIGVGGTFDYLTGKATLPPEWVNRFGLEWLWRLMHQPWRLKRQLSLVKFTLKVLFR